MPMEKKLKEDINLIENESIFPEHVPLIGYDLIKEQQKEELRKFAKKLREQNGKIEAIVTTKSGVIKKASQLTKEEQEDEILKCIVNPIYFIETYLTIFDQTAGVAGLIVPFILFTFQKDLINTYRDNRFVIANKYRQAGISTTTCAYIAWYIMFNNNRSAAIVADKLETAKDELMNDVVDFISGCPAWLRPKTGKETDDKFKDTQKLKRYDNGSTLSAFSSKGLRGYTPTLLFWDETAWTEKSDKFWTSAKPTLQTGGAAIMVSTPSGLDAVFYKTFDGARKKKNNFIAVELWWFNDPRYNKELVWLRNKGKTNVITLKDTGFTNVERIKLMDDGWEASSPWFEEQVMDANGDMRKIAQEILCVNFDSKLTICNKKTSVVETITISELYKRVSEENNFFKSYSKKKQKEIIKNSPKFTLQLNNKYEILNNSGKFVNFLGIEKSGKKPGLKITLENDETIIVGEDHIFISSNKNMYAKSLIPNVAYLSTSLGDFYVKSVEPVEDCDLYDIVDSEGCEYSANGFSNHNCSFLGSGDNFIAETYLKRIQENEIRVPIRQEYLDRNMWIFEDPIVGEEYIIAVDASPGHGEDNSTVNLLKKTEIIEIKNVTKNGKTKQVKIRRHKVEQVAEYYGKVVPQTLAEIVYQYGRIYNNAYCVVDITGGYGVQVIEKLLEIGYENIHYAEVSHKPSRDRLQGYIKKGQKAMMDGTIITVDLIPGFFIGSNRASVLLELQRAIHLEDIIIRSNRLLDELKTFVTVAGNRVADHKRSFHDDSIMGMSIGLYVLNFDMARFKQSKGITEKMINAIMTVNDMEEMKRRKLQEDINNGIKPKPNNPMISPSSSNPMNPYAANSWLFDGLKQK